MSTSSTVSVPLFLMGVSCQRTVIITVELRRGQALTPTFIKADVIAGLVYEHMNVECVVVQKLDANATLLVSLEG